MIKNPPKKGSIIQITKDDRYFKYCLATVTDSSRKRVMAYVQNAGSKGQAYIFLYEGEYEETGGTAPFIVDHEEGCYYDTV